MVTVAKARSLLGTGKPRRVRNWTQRAEDPPYLNCRYYAWLVLAWWAGLRWDGGIGTAVAITDLLRRKSGRPEVIGGKLQGSSTSDLDKALAEVFPWMRLQHRMVHDGDLVEGLGRDFVATIAVWLPDVRPSRLTTYSGRGSIGHAVDLVGGREQSGDVRYLDVLSPSSHGGWWTPFNQLKPALMQRSGSSTFCTLMEVGDPMLTTIRPVEAFHGGGATAVLKPDTYKVFRVTSRGDFQRAKDMQLATRQSITVGYVAKVERMPADGPRGRFYYITDGPGKGKFIKASTVSLTRPDPAGDTEAARRAGYTEGYEAASGLYVPTEADLYERVDA